MSKHFKRVLALVLALVMILGLLPTVAFAEDASTPSQLEDGRGLGKKVPDRYVSTRNITPKTSTPKTALPASYNSKTLGYITPIRNQGSYGTCWAHGAIASCEAYMIKHGVKVGTGNAATTSLNLSELHLAWFGYTDAYDKLGLLAGDKTTALDDYRDLGGFGEIPTYTLMRWEGLASESTSALAYSKASSSANGLNSSYAYNYNVAHVQDCVWIPTSDRTAVKEAIMEYGAGTFGYYADDNYEQNDGSYYYPSSESSNHDVTVVGWDDNYSKSKFSPQPSGNGAWIIKNSWGTSYGTNGYYYISYYDVPSNNDTCYFYKVEDVDNYDNNYQYDGTTNFNNYMQLKKNGSVANVFTANGTETLEAVAFCNWDAGMSYKCDIYKNPTGNNPTSGTLVSTKSGTFEYAGYHTVELDTTVSLSAGDKFSVVFTNTGSSTIDIGLDQTGSSSGWVSWTHSSPSGASYYTNSGSWTDYSGTANLRIKAYTKNGQVVQDPCTITLKAGTSTYQTVNTTTNTSASLPSYTGTVPTGYTFSGWTASTISGTTQSAPTLYNGSYATGSNTAITLYACFSKTEGGSGSGTGAWTLLENASTLSSGMKVVFASEAQGKTAGDISSAIMASVDSTFSSDGKTITSLGSDTVQMTVGGSSGAWTFANSDGDLLGATAVKKLAWGSGTTTWSVSVSDGSATIQNGTEANGRFLYNVGSPRFTTYTSNTSVSMLLPEIYYMNGTAGTTTYTTTITTCSHTYAESDRLDATCTEEGTIEYTCSKCGDRYYDDIPALGHQLSYTYYDEDMHEVVCTRSGCTYNDLEECTYVNGTCSKCGHVKVLDTYTVSYNVLGSVVNTASCVEGQSVTLPATATAVEGFTFAGWVKNAINNETTSAPTVLTGSYKPTANTTLYALYTRTGAGTGGGSGDYVKVTKTSDLTNGQYLIVYEDGEVALDGSLATIDAVEDTIDVTISNNTIPANTTTNAAAFTFTASNGAFLGTNGKYIGHTGTSNTLNTSTSAMSNTVSIDSDGNAVIDAGSSYVLRYNNTSGQYRFRFYKGTQQPIQLYKKGAGSSSTTYYTTAPVYVAPCEHTNTSVVNAAAATCTSAGYTGDTVCNGCGTTVATGTAIAALGHSYGAFTSNNNGTHSKTCSRCSHKVTEDCSFTTSTSGATTTFTCSVCNYSYSTTLDTYTVSYNVLGSVVNTASCVEGQSVTLPATATAVDGYTFAGWVKNAITSETTTAPAILTGSYKPTANVTLYALYTRTEAGSGTGAAPSAAFAPGDIGDYVIAAQKGGTWYALPNAPTLSSGKIEGEVITVSDNNGIKYVTTANAEGYVWTVAKSGSYYTISDGSKSLYHSNGGASGTNLSYGTSANYPWSIYTSNDNILLAGVVNSTSTVGSRGILFRIDGDYAQFGGYSLSNATATDYTNVILLPVSGGSGDTTYYTTAPVVEEECTHENTTLTGAVAATCEAAGYTGDYVCDDCGTTVTTGTAIAALGHDLVAGAIITPTCATAGYTEYNCSRCDYSENKDEVAALGHDLSWDGVVGNGINHTLACARCDYTATEPCTIVNGACSVCGYAAKTAEIGDYARVTAALDDWSGTYLIVYEGSSYAFNGSLSTPNAAANYNTVTIVDGVVVGDDTVDAYAVTIEKVEGTDYYTIKLGSGKYMGNTGTSTGINASTTKYQNAISLDGDGNAIIANTSGTNTYNIRFNSGSSSNRFAFYGTSTGYAVKLYKRVECDHNWGTGVITTPATCTAEGVMTYTCSICSESKTEAIPMAAHTPAAYPEAAASCTKPGSTGGTYCSVCSTELTAATVIPALGHDLAWDGNVGNGTNHVLACSRCEYTENEACNIVDGTCTVCGYGAETPIEPTVKINSAALRLGENIDLIYTASVPEDATNVYMTFTMNGETVTVEDDGTHIFAFTAINPQCMGDNVAAILYATVSGTEYTDEIATYSVRQYCINKLADSSVTGTLRTLISDVLAYGAAAQTYMNYNTSALVNSGSDVKNPTYSTFTSLSGLNATFTGTAAESPCWIGASLDLSNNVAMVFRFASPNKTGLSVKVTYNGKTTTFSGTSITAVSGMSGVYEVKLTGIKATDFDETVSASFYKSSAQVGNMVSYSVNTYICAKQVDNDANLAALVKALYNYGASAKAYNAA